MLNSNKNDVGYNLSITILVLLLASEKSVLRGTLCRFTVSSPTVNNKSKTNLVTI